MFWLLDTLKEQEVVHILITMWAIWWARLRAIHDEQYQSPLSTSVFIKKFLVDLDCMAMYKSRLRDLHAKPKDLHVSAGNSRTRATSSGWLPPTDEEAKLNVDGGVSRSGRRGAASVVCHDRAGAFLGASARVFEGLMDPPLLEAQSCNEALALAMDLNLDSICVASDCAAVISMIGSDVPCQFASVLSEINHRARFFPNIHFIHENRKHNFEAHALAKDVVSLSPGRHLWLLNTPDIICIPMNIQI